MVGQARATHVGVDTGRRRRDAEEVVVGAPSRAWAVLGVPSAGRVFAGAVGLVVRDGLARAMEAKGPPQLYGSRVTQSRRGQGVCLEPPHTRAPQMGPVELS